ncbi:S-adenosylmethionine:tRNA ribosyltransferase-isomerase, partial [Patescibacteria group bacterium]
MQLSDFHYVIPDELIADQPPKVRGTTRLLTLDRITGNVADKKYADIVGLLSPGDVLVINDTKVIKARLIATKPSGGERELVLVEKHGEADDWHRHRVIYRRKLKAGDELTVGKYAIHVEEIVGDGIAIIRSDTDLLQVADEFGSVPLPPYMRRDATSEDIERYQTVWAREQGSVAAPTASLNMTNEMLEKLQARGIKVVYATLHVGLGTFLPIRVDDVTTHKMHQEYFEVPKSTVEAIQVAKKRGNQVVALGTTITRTLEYCHDEILNKPAKDLQGEADIFMYP